MAGDDLAALIDQHRRHEAELENGGRDLRHLFGGVRARIPGIGQQGGDRVRLDGARRPWGLGHAYLLESMMVVGIADRRGWQRGAVATWKNSLALGMSRASAPRIQRG
jgi:hypothetical protein